MRSRFRFKNSDRAHGTVLVESDDMNEAELKDGRIITIECWNFDDLKAHTLSRTRSERKERRATMFEGFNYYGSNIIDDLRRVNTERYSEARGLSDFEKQADPNLPNEQYHRAIVALHDQKIIGMLLCQWTNNRYFPFWLYHMKFVDVNREFQNQSVATHLVRELDRTHFTIFYMVV